MRSCPSLRILCAFSLLLAVSVSPAAAQDEALVETLSQLMGLQDIRRYDDGILRDASRHPDPIVRRHAALTMGRIGDPTATIFLAELLLDRNPGVQADAAFAMGLMEDLAGFSRLREFVLNTPVDEQNSAHEEAVTAILRIGGSEAVDFLREFFGRYIGSISTNVPGAVRRGLVEAWRLGDGAPVDLMRRFLDSDDGDVQWSAIYSLARIGAPSAADLLLAATDSPIDSVRYIAVRALTAAFADSSGLDRGALASRVRRLINDPAEFVRINALRALASFADPADAPDVIDRISDSDPNVRVQAVAALGRLGGEEAVATLLERVGDGLFAVRRQALISLAGIPHSGVIGAVADLVSSDDWLDRMTAAQVLGTAGGDTALAWLDYLTQDPDARVVAAALEGVVKVDSAYGTDLAREYYAHPDFVVRVVAANQLGLSDDVADIGLLAESYLLALADGQPDARIAVVHAVGSMSRRGRDQARAAENLFVARFPSSTDYLVRRAAADSFPLASERWGPERPVETHREMGDYRDIVRRLVLPAELDGINPRIKLETDRGEIILELFAADAPLTVQAFLELIELRSLDAGRWHRVVPNFVLQDGDPRGDGWGGPNYVLRDEINRRRYDRGTVGMALSGPDTGGSQFFIAHSAQPHLNGIYPVIGRVIGGYNVLDGITQGDRIRRIRRD